MIEKKKLSNIVLVLGCVILNAVAQLLLKHGMNQIGSLSFHLHELLIDGLAAITNTFIILGIVIYAISVVGWLFVLSRIAVSIAYPLTSVGYIICAVLAYYLMGEPLPPIHLLGIFVILFGTYIVSTSNI